ncbi:glycosyl hydrolase [Neolewinella lacunae]|uniref:Glycosyl hydrolase n=1 Tax=Neolewinella lacunae TaxID=1517758 RepID=A0A923PMT5_9BACT|nr:glycosyl hydrolase [Neolewinella lacunae]MBC6996344.1 glycosyl hydrolase [Neolewinella lacunae]MDN3636967.1 glycosyl hydrolase [Neolewinella lacunae]
MRTAFSCFLLLLAGLLLAQDGPKTLEGFKLRNVGPAFVAGRISDIAVHPNNDNLWYVGVASGGVWKTRNAGITWEPIFDNEGTYATGCITIDPLNPSTVWVGTGENVGGRHIAFGDGIYRSTDGGKKWQNMGLKTSEHISKIIVHPANSNVVWVAAQGPLWSSGGDRGVFKTTDGGKTWKKVLGGSEWTGATDLLLDPRNPDLLYAATWDRHRTVAAYLGGGPGSGIHRSRDGGETWEKLSAGLPSSNLGKIGLAISPQQPDVVYAAITLDRRTGGIWRSANQGANWNKMSDVVSGGTGPHYYQELYASPHAFDRLYLMDVRIQISEDGGKTFRRMKEERKHSDNHAIVFRADDPDYLLIGTDAGLYESFDLAENWRFIDNMPITQYYKVAVDDREPFYHIFGGTQDNGSHGGPSRTDSEAGILNGDWYKTLFADGHQSATEPGNPDIIYAETQQGGLHRVDLKTGEPIMVQPQARAGEPFERFNWDAPILVSRHDPKRLYFASYRVWRSDSRGDDWQPISGDLTRNEERIARPIMGGIQSWDNPWDIYAMSSYSTITSLAESALNEKLLWAGTDDGILQVTTDGGTTWKKMWVKDLPGVPERAFINDIKADKYDENTVYVSLDNHKEGDYKPYLFKSTNLGKSWTNLGSSLPDRTLVWRLVQDHVKKDLLFIATENGIYTSLNGGGEWKKLAGSPHISFRDLAIQERENDLVGASFGRSFWVLDDYSPLREMSDEAMAKEGALFSVRDAWWYSPRDNDPGVGADQYAAENPEFGAVFTYNLNTEFKSLADQRKAAEKEAQKNKQPLTFPGYDALDKESSERQPKVWFTIKDANGEVVRTFSKPLKKGLHRTAWDLRMPSTWAIRAGEGGGGGGRFGGGAMAPPGKYSVTMSKEVDGKITELAGPVSFNVKPLHKPTVEGASPEAILAYREEVKGIQDQMAASQEKLGKLTGQIKAMETALAQSAVAPGKLHESLYALQDQINALERQLEGSPSRAAVGENGPPTVQDHFFAGYRGLSTTYGPTPNMRRSLGIAGDMLKEINPKIDALSAQLPALKDQLKAVGAPYLIGADMDKE